VRVGLRSSRARKRAPAYGRPPARNPTSRSNVLCLTSVALFLLLIRFHRDLRYLAW